MSKAILATSAMALAGIRDEKLRDLVTIDFDPIKESKSASWRRSLILSWEYAEAS